MKKLIPRVSQSPEKLIVAGITYRPDSACARTFLFVGDVVAWSHHYHLQIIHSVKAMENERDRKAAKAYATHFDGKLTPEGFKEFLDNWSGVLGDVRRRQKAGRIWLDVPDESGKLITVISFWAHEKSINRQDIERIRDTFKAHSGVYVDFYDNKNTLYLRARPGHGRR